MVVLDTCAIINLLQKDIISRKTLLLINQGAFLLSISFAEIACKVNIGKLDLGGKNVMELYEEYSDIQSIEMIDIDGRHWMQAINLDWPLTKIKQHKDSADRLILSFALDHKLPIVSSDQMMK